MSNPKPQTWRPNQRAKDFFRGIAEIPGEIVTDGQWHEFVSRGGAFEYAAGCDDSGPFVMVARTYRPPAKKPQAKLYYIRGGKT